MKTAVLLVSCGLAQFHRVTVYVANEDEARAILQAARALFAYGAA